MSEQEEIQVTLTKRQIQLLLIIIHEPREMRPNFRFTLGKAEHRLRQALKKLEPTSEEQA